MIVVSAVPFTLKRGSDLYTSGGGYESTTETAHGLVRLEEDRLVIQWRVALLTESMEGSGYETREAIDPVKPNQDAGRCAVGEGAGDDRESWQLAVLSQVRGYALRQFNAEALDAIPDSLR